MKDFKYLILIVLVFSIAVPRISANTKTKSHKKSTNFLSIHSIGISLAYYKPYLSNWNNSPISWIRADRNNLYPAFSAEINLFSFLLARIEAGNNQQSVWKPITNFGENSINYNLFPILGSLFIDLLPDSKDAKIYLGAGAGNCFIRQTYSFFDQSTGLNGSSITSGSDFLYFISGEIEDPVFLNFFSMGFEIRYNFGSFNQEYTFNNILTSDKISFNGISVGLKFKYLFNKSKYRSK